MKKLLFMIFLLFSFVLLTSCFNDDEEFDEPKVEDKEEEKEDEQEQEEKYYDVIFDGGGGEPNNITKRVLKGTLVEKPVDPTYKAHLFIGWYNDGVLYDFELPIVRTIVLVAHWEVDPDYDEGEKEMVDFNEFINSVDTYMDEFTISNYLTDTSLATATYTSSNKNLLVIEDGVGYINKVYQNHQEQKLTVSINVTLNDGSYVLFHKDVTVGPIVYEKINSTPIATYFYTQAMGQYRTYSNHYKETGKIFTDEVKENLDIIYYSFVIPQSNGTVRIENTSFLREVRELKKYGTRVLFTIDGVGANTAAVFKEVTSTKEKIDVFVKNIMDLVDKHYLDGVDIDWEPFSGGVVASQLDDLMIALRAEMNKRQANGGTPYILSTAIPGGVVSLKPEWFNLETLFDVADYINFMTYTLNESSRATHHTSLSGGALNLITYLDGKNYPLNKVIIGSGAYGIAFKLNETGIENPVNQSAKTTIIEEFANKGSFPSGTVYVHVLEELLKREDYELFHDYSTGGVIKGSYLYNIEEGIFITFESELSATEKVNIIKTFPGMGVMTWSFSQDPNDYVINALINARNNDSK